jgi:sigma-54 specific flagellar transcriptional regulator A
VRELSNLIERLAILFPEGGLIDVHNLPEKYRSGDPAFVIDASMALITGPRIISNDAVSPMRLPEEGINLREKLNQLEYFFIRQALIECDGVVAHAAKRLHLGRTTLVEKLRRIGHDLPDGESIVHSDEAVIKNIRFTAMPGN